MVETPRAALTADRLAEHADFFSVGSNDLTQTTYALSRDDAETSFLVDYLRTGVFEQDPFTSLDAEGVGKLVDMAIASAAPARTGSRSASAVSTAATRPRSPGATSTASPTSAARPSACPSPGSPPPRRPWGKATDVTTPAENTHDDRTGQERFFQRSERHHTPRAVSTGNWSGDLTPLPDLQQTRSRTGPVRQERPVYVDLLPPCNSACPAGENIQGWLAQMNAGNHEQAWRVLVADNPFPAIHGRVCYHPCETSCNRAQLDSAVSIHSVERFLSYLAVAAEWSLIMP